MVDKKLPKKEKVVKKEKKLTGRPPIYTEELAEFVCRMVATHTWGLQRICREVDGMPDQTTINEWRLNNPSFSLRYTKAKQVQAELLAEECLDISDDARGDIKITKDGEEVFNTEFAARSRIRIDTRKWLAAKLSPKIYGDRQIVEQVSSENEDLKKEIADLREKLDSKYKRDY